MKKYAHLITLLIGISICVSSQEMKQLKISGNTKKLNNELTFRRDQNGNYCAAIQIISDLDGFDYDSNDGIIGLDDKKGKDIIYLTASERVLEVYMKGYKPEQIILSDHGIILKPQEIWQISIAGESATDEIPVIIEYSPTDASLFVDNQLLSGTTHTLTAGKHIIRIEKSSYSTIEKEIVVYRGNAYFTESLEKVEDAILQIESIPEDLTIYLNNVKLGDTPLSVFYPPGSYSIRIVKDSIELLNEQNLIIRAPLTRKIFNFKDDICYLSINTFPEAEVYFNEKLMTNYKKVKLTPQKLKVRVLMSGADPIEQELELINNDDVILNLFPIKRTCTIQIPVTPFDSQIEIINESCEKYSAIGSHKFDNMVPGLYLLKIQDTGYITYKKIIKLKPGDKMDMPVKLTKMNNSENNVALLPEMVFVKGGCFNMGSDDGTTDEKPVHQVCLDDFYIGKFEVSQEIWENIMRGNPSSRKCDEFPVENITLSQISKFIQRLNDLTGKNYRLPTEAEWEYACKGGDLSKSYIFSGSDSLYKVGWYDINSNHTTHFVGIKEPNELGVYDMSGNVQEYCCEQYDANFYYNSPRINPKAETYNRFEYRSVRGGSYINKEANCRSSSRSSIYYSTPKSDVGFRLALIP
jgi:formylglycine-generating enzyme required for sulfatase activity